MLISLKDWSGYWGMKNLMKMYFQIMSDLILGHERTIRPGKGDGWGKIPFHDVSGTRRVRSAPITQPISWGEKTLVWV